MSYVTSWERTAKKEGKREGLKIGMENNAKETAKRMLDDGLPVESISKYTGLPIEEIKKLMIVSN